MMFERKVKGVGQEHVKGWGMINVRYGVEGIYNPSCAVQCNAM